jgi:peptide/nickel transport system permease protein
VARFLLRRVGILLATLFAGSLLVFLVMQVLPGDPAAIVLGTGARPDTLAVLRHQMGLDQPVLSQYLRWLGGLVTLRLGLSISYHVPVSELIGDRVLVTVPLAAIAIIVSTTIAIPLGIFAAGRRGRWSDAALMGAAQIGVAIPNFWAGLLLILLFAVHLAWLPAGGFPGWGAGAWPALRALILPAAALALPQAAVLARVTRAAVVDVLGEDFVRTARAKGLTRRQALWRHAAPNALVPVATIIGLQFAFLLAGTVIVENVFTLPGLGRLLFQAIEQRDLPVVQDLVVMLAATVIVVNFCVDLAYAALDPRLRP